MEQDLSEGSRNADDEINQLNYSNQDLDQSVGGDAKCRPVLKPCGYQDSKNHEDSDESKSTLVDFPFAVSIQRKGAHYASGALVDKRWVLTSAGEFFNVRESIKLFKARLGSVDCKRGGLLMPLKSIEIHPNYVHKEPNFDVSLVHLGTPLVFSDVIKPVTISNRQGIVSNAKFLTTYWPRIVMKDFTLPESAKERVKYNSMRVSTQQLIPAADCRRRMTGYNQSLDSSSLCLRPVLTHHSVCMPDAGAPVLAEDGLWGITSGWVSPSCHKSPGPTIFTRVSAYLVKPWIDEHLHRRKHKKKMSKRRLT